VPARYISAELGFLVGGGACPVNEPDYIPNELQNCYDVVTIPHCPGPIELGGWWYKRKSEVPHGCHAIGSGTSAIQGCVGRTETLGNSPVWEEEN
jgi:hypothetical protein